MDHTTGGDVNYKTSWTQWLIISLAVIVILILVIKNVKHMRFGKENYYQRKLRQNFTELHGDAYDDEAADALAYGEEIKDKTAIDHFRLGTIQLVNAKNPEKANDHFRQALDQIIEQKVNPQEAIFMIDRIDDFKDFLVDQEIDLPMQAAIAAHYEQKIAEKKTPEISDADNTAQAKQLISSIAWQSDSQNVHDQAVYDDLKSQFYKVRDENIRLTNVKNKDWKDLTAWMRASFAHNPERWSKLIKVLDVISNDYPVQSLNCTEKELVEAIWKRAYDDGNIQNQDSIKSALADALIDCVEGESVVCMSGRNSKVWQALATLDKDPAIGIFRTKQQIRNEIYDRSARIINDYVGPNGSASDSLRNAYQAGETTEQVAELTQCIRDTIDELRASYENKLPEDQLNLIIEECKSVV